jgi:hypothetical protein
MINKIIIHNLQDLNRKPEDEVTVNLPPVAAKCSDKKGGVVLLNFEKLIVEVCVTKLQVIFGRCKTYSQYYGRMNGSIRMTQ